MVDGFNNYRDFLKYCQENGECIIIVIKGVSKTFNSLTPIEQGTISRKWWISSLTPVIMDDK